MMKAHFSSRIGLRLLILALPLLISRGAFAVSAGFAEFAQQANENPDVQNVNIKNYKTIDFCHNGTNRQAFVFEDTIEDSKYWLSTKPGVTLGACP